MFRTNLAGAIIATAVVVLGACGGSGDDKTTATPAETALPATAAASAAAATPATAATPRATLPPTTAGADLDEASAAALINAVVLVPEDLDVIAPWTLQSDTTADNAAFAAAQPEQAGDVEACGRLVGRTVTLQPEDIINAFIGGQTLTFFSQVTVYKNPDGATACANTAAQRLAAPGALARQFGGVFIDPAAVVVTPVEFPSVAEGSFAATLTGQTNAQGTIVDITILVVAFKSGSATVAVGSVRSGATPPQDELKQYVDLVLQRLEANQ
ncbi:MAG: hypothetical protein HY873_03205 [Chloroflexi bacterium]|nr:hypothetical protein [Chloroflexota bacterium]